MRHADDLTAVATLATDEPATVTAVDSVSAALTRRPQVLPARVGQHVIADMWESSNLNDPDILERALREAVEAIRGTLLDVRVYTFPVHGVTGVAVIAESHVAVHTWPEYGYAAVDLFSCNVSVDLQAGVDAISRHLLPTRIDLRKVNRGERIVDLNQ